MMDCLTERIDAVKPPLTISTIINSDGGDGMCKQTLGSAT